MSGQYPVARDGRSRWRGRIPGADLLRVIGMLWLVRLALWSAPLSTVLMHLDARRAARARRRPPRSPGGRTLVERRVRLGSQVVPRCTCLVQALVAEQLLTELGYACVVRLGAAKTASNQLAAHAWVECEGRLLMGGNTVGFVEFRRAEPPVIP